MWVRLRVSTHTYTYTDTGTAEYRFVCDIPTLVVETSFSRKYRGSLFVWESKSLKVLYVLHVHDSQSPPIHGWCVVSL